MMAVNGMRSPGRLGAAGAVRTAGAVAIACIAVTGRAVDDRVEEAPVPGGVVQHQVNVIDLGANFDANLLEQPGGFVLRGNGLRGRRPSPTGELAELDESAALARLRRLGHDQLARVDRTCTLSADQRRRLELAVESDARRLAAEIDAIRSAYVGTVANVAEPDGQKKWQQFQLDVQRCRTQLQQAFAAGSLFSDVLGGTLDERQQASYDAETRSRRAFRWRAMVMPVLLKMDETVGLDAKQHALIERLLLAAEPRLATVQPSGRRNAHAEQMLVYLQLSRSDARAIREQLSERQWQAVSMMMNQGKAMRSWLDQQGLVESER